MHPIVVIMVPYFSLFFGGGGGGYDALYGRLVMTCVCMLKGCCANLVALV